MGTTKNSDAIFGVLVVILICSTRVIDCCSGGKSTDPGTTDPETTDPGKILSIYSTNTRAK